MNQHSLPFGVCIGAVLILSAGCMRNQGSTQSEYVFLSPPAHLDGADAHGLWNRRGDKEELLFLVLVPTGIEATIVILDRTGGTPEPDTITVLPEGLFQDGSKVETTATRRIFVLSKKGALQPVETSSDVLLTLDRSAVDQFDSTELWRSQIEPLLR